MIHFTKNKILYEHWVLVLCLLIIVQSFFGVFACSIPPTPPYSFVETRGFGGDCYSKIVYPNHDSYSGVRTEIYASKDDLKPIVLFPKQRWNIKLYCNRKLDNQDGVIIVSLNSWMTQGTYGRVNSLSFYFNSNFKKMYLDLDLTKKGFEGLRRNYSFCEEEHLVWSESVFEKTWVLESILDEFGRQSVSREFKNDSLSVIGDREVLSLLAIDQSILVFDLLTGEFIERKVP